MLDCIQAKASENLAALPNYTCTLTIRRSQENARTGKLEDRDTVRLEVAMIEGKEQFGWPGDKRIDEPEIARLVKTGAIGSGMFGLMTRNVFLSTFTSFLFVAEEERSGRRALKYAYHVPAGSSGCRLVFDDRDVIAGYEGLFWVDRDTLDLIELEFEAKDIPPSLRKAAARGRIEYSRAGIGGAARLLPAVAELILQDPDGLESRNLTLFHGCREFAGQSFISFTDPAPATARSTEPKVAEVTLPERVSLKLVLESGIREYSAIGERVRLTVNEPLKHKGRILAPKGAVVTGRIQRLEERSGFFLIEIGFDGIEWEGSRADLSRRRNLLSVNRPAQVYYGGPGRIGRPGSGTFGDTGEPGMLIAPAPLISLSEGTSITLKSAK